MRKYLKVNARLLLAVSTISAPSLMPSTAFAQSNSTEQTIGAVSDLLGMIAQGAAKANAKKAWSQLDPQVVQCVNTIFESKNITADQFVAAGVAPNDARVAPIINLCNVVLTTQLKADFPCSVTNSMRQQVSTACVESYAVDNNGTLNPVSRDDFLRAFGNEQKVQVANFETTDAQKTRLMAEQQQAEAARQKAEADRQRYLASPEGKRQLALQAASEAKAAAERKAAAAAFNREHPFYAVLSCSINGQHVNILACFGGDVGTEIELKNGSAYGLYKVYQISGLGRENRAGLTIDLKSSFSIVAQNSNKTLILGISVYNRAGGTLIYQKQVSQYGVVRYSR